MVCKISNGMKKLIIFVVIVILLGVVAYMFQIGTKEVANPTGSPSPEVSVSPSVSPTVSVSPSASPTATVVSSIKTFTVVGKPFSFTPSQITVNKGDTVVIIFKNESGTHDWKIDEFNSATKILQSGQQETIQFVANKVGTFEYYCSIGTHRQQGMKGNLTVK